MFFDSRQRQLAQQGETLQLRSAALRHAIARDGQALRKPLALADQVRAGWRWLKAHPQWVGVGAAVLVVWRPRRVLRFGARGWALWRLWRRAQRWQALGQSLGLGRQRP